MTPFTTAKSSVLPPNLVSLLPSLARFLVAVGARGPADAVQGDKVVVVEVCLSPPKTALSMVTVAKNWERGL